MKIKILLLSSLLLLAAPLTSCNNSKVTLTLRSGIGTFEDSSNTKVLTVNRGTSLTSLNIESPIYEGFKTNTWQDQNGKLISNLGDTADDYKVYVDTTLWANFFEDISAVRGISIGMVSSAMMDAIARQPEAASLLNLNFSLCYNAIDASNNCHDIMAIGTIGKSAMDAIARQPESEVELRKVSTYCYESIIALGTKDGRSEAMGRIGASAMDAIARQPEAAGYLFNGLRISYTGVATSPNAAKAHGIGDAGSSAMEAIARQPESYGTIIKALCLTIERINNN